MLDITKSLKNVSITIRDTVDEECRAEVYLSLFTEFDECDFLLDEVLNLDPILDEVLEELFPEMIEDVEEEPSENGSRNEHRREKIYQKAENKRDGKSTNRS